MINAVTAQLALQEYNHQSLLEGKETADGSFLRASSISFCIRQQMFAGLNAPKDNLGGLSNFAARKIGDAMHHELQEAMKQSDWFEEFDCEMSVSLPEYIISGHTDGMYKHKDLGKTVVEIKTMKNWAFRHAREEGPKEEHLLQASTYALALGADNIHIIYMCSDSTPKNWKNNASVGEMQEWIFQLDDFLSGYEELTLRKLTRIVLGDQLMQVERAFESGELPDGISQGYIPLDDKDRDWRCNYCDYLGLCDTSYQENWNLEQVIQVSEK